MGGVCWGGINCRAGEKGKGGGRSTVHEAGNENGEMHCEDLFVFCLLSAWEKAMVIAHFPRRSYSCVLKKFIHRCRPFLTGVRCADSPIDATWVPCEF